MLKWYLPEPFVNMISHTVDTTRMSVNISVQNLCWTFKYHPLLFLWKLQSVYCNLISYKLFSSYVAGLQHNLCSEVQNITYVMFFVMF